MTTAHSEAGSRSMSKDIDPGLQAVFNALQARADRDESLATKTELADALGIKKQAITQWRHVPIAHVLMIEQLLRVPRHVLRPDVYPDPRKDKRYGRVYKARS